VRYALGFPIWGDEGFVAVTLQEHSFRELFHPQEYGQVAPLLWWWLEKAMLTVCGGSVWALRLPSILAAVATTWLMLRFLLRALPERSAVFAYAIFAVSYYPLRHGIELKPYALDLLWAVVMMDLAWSLLQEGPRDSRRLLGLMAMGLVGVWASFPSLFLSSAIGTVLFVRWWPGSLRRMPWTFLALLLWGGLLIFEVSWMSASYADPHIQAAPWLPAMDMWTRTFPPTAEWWRFPWWWLSLHTGWLSAYPTGGPPPGSALNFALIVAGAVALWRRAMAGFVVLLLAPLLFNLAAAYQHAYPYGGSVRVSIYMAPAFCLLMGHGLAVLLARLRPRAEAVGTVIMLSLLLLFGAVGVARDVHRPYKGLSDRNSAAFAKSFAAQVRPGDRVVVGLAVSPDGKLSLLDHGGSFARLRYELERHLPDGVRLEYQPTEGQEVDMAGNDATIWFLAYQDDNQTLLPYDQAAMSLLLRKLEAQGGQATPVDERVLEKEEAVTLWRIDRAAAELR